MTCAPAAGGWACRVRLTDARGSADYRVGVSDADLARFAPGASQPDDLVRRSFEFLLAREPRTSILSTFDLPVIERYFPEYPDVIRA